MRGFFGGGSTNRIEGVCVDESTQFVFFEDRLPAVVDLEVVLDAVVSVPFV